MVGYLCSRPRVGAGVWVEAQRLGTGPHVASQQDGEDVAVDDLTAGLLLSLVLLVRIVVAVEVFVTVPVPCSGPSRSCMPLRQGV